MQQAVGRVDLPSEKTPGAAAGRVGLGALLTATAHRHPDRILIVDPADKAAWSGRPAIAWTYAAAAEIVARLAADLEAWRLPAGSRVGLCLPPGAEAALALLAVDAAGFVPCLLPLAWDEDRLVAAAEEAGLAAILTQARLGALAPAERLCRVAARYFGLRYLAAFGPDVPDGVINLDRSVVGRRVGAAPRPHPPPAGLVTFDAGRPDRPVLRDGGALVAAAAAHLLVARVGPGERILSLHGGADLLGLATGLAAALVAGASLETLPVFDSVLFAQALSRTVPTHLVAPAFLEGALLGRPLPASLHSIRFSHRPPARLSRRGLLPACLVFDVMAFDETAVVTGLRGGGSDLARVLGRSGRLDLPQDLLALERAPDGALAFRGRAAEGAPLQCESAEAGGNDPARRIRYEALALGGVAVEVRRLSEGAGTA